MSYTKKIDMTLTSTRLQIAHVAKMSKLYECVSEREH